MKITPTSAQCLYVEMDGWTFYIDNSTNEQIVDRWKDSWPEDRVDELNHQTSRLAELPVEQQAKIVNLINTIASIKPDEVFVVDLIESLREKIRVDWKKRNRMIEGSPIIKTKKTKKTKKSKKKSKPSLES